MSKIESNTEEVTLNHDNERQYFKTACAPFKYREPITDIILALKYGSTGEAAEFLAPYMARSYAAISPAGIIVPVPLYKKRQSERGYNQAELLSRGVAKILGLPVNDKALVRVRETRVQKHMTPKERLENLKGAFNVTNKEQVKDKTIILVDDVFTTGSTVNECAKVLLKAGARRVEVLVASLA